MFRKWSSGVYPSGYEQKFCVWGISGPTQCRHEFVVAGSRMHLASDGAGESGDAHSSFTTHTACCFGVRLHTPGASRRHLERASSREPHRDLARIVVRGTGATFLPARHAGTRWPRHKIRAAPATLSETSASLRRFWGYPSRHPGSFPDRPGGLRSQFGPAVRREAPRRDSIRHELRRLPRRGFAPARLAKT